MDLKRLFRLNRKNEVMNSGEEMFSSDKIEDSLLHKIHPKQIINKTINMPTVFYEVKYQYTTVRRNRKTGTKYFIFTGSNPQIDMENEFDKWVQEYNKNNPERQLLNVKLLKSKCLGFILFD